MNENFFGFPKDLDEDKLLRDLIISSSFVLTEEKQKELENDAAWVEITDEGIVFSKGIVELFRLKDG